MIVLRFRVLVKPDHIDEAVAAFSAVAPPSREIDGVVSFDIGRDLNDPNAIIATEVFADEAARERQEAQPEVAHIMTLLPEILAAPPEATIFHVSSTTDALATA